MRKHIWLYTVDIWMTYRIQLSLGWLRTSRCINNNIWNQNVTQCMLIFSWYRPAFYFVSFNYCVLQYEPNKLLLLKECTSAYTLHNASVCHQMNTKCWFVSLRKFCQAGFPSSFSSYGSYCDGGWDCLDWRTFCHSHRTEAFCWYVLARVQFLPMASIILWDRNRTDIRENWDTALVLWLDPLLSLYSIDDCNRSIPL